MNYTLNLNLEGADKAEAALDSLLKKISMIGGGSNMPTFDKWLSSGGIESEGEKIGGTLEKGISKGLKFNQISSAWGKAILKGTNDFWKDAIKLGDANSNPIKGLKEPGGKDLAKVLGMGDISEIGKGMIKGLRDVSGGDLAKVFGLGDISQFNKTGAEGMRGYGMKNRPGMGLITPQFPDFKMQEFKPQLDKLKVGIAAIATLFNPFVGARLLSDVIPKGHMSGGKGVSGAIFGAAGAAGYGEIFVVVKVLETAFKLLSKAVMNTLQAYDTARQLYAKSLMQGLGLNFAAKRGMLAEVLGVGETDVLRFGQAMNYLNPKLAFAAETLAKTAIPLTGVGWEFKILEENMKAIWAIIAEGVAPAVKAFLIELNDFLSTLGQTGVLNGLATILNTSLQTLVNVVGGFEILVNASVLGLKTIADAIALMIIGTINLLAKIPGAGKLGINHIDSSPITKDLAASYSAFGKEAKNYFKNFNGAKLNDVPNPSAQMKQMGVSTLEKMGLVVGGSSNNYQKDISNNTKATVDAIKLLQQTMARAAGATGGYFGMSPFQAQP